MKTGPITEARCQKRPALEEAVNEGIAGVGAAWRYSSLDKSLRDPVLPVLSWLGERTDRAWRSQHNIEEEKENVTSEP